MSAALSLLTLPLEVLIQIFGLLEGHQVAKCSAVCSYFKDTIESSIALQYLVKLDTFGYVDIPGPASIPTVPAIRLNQLQRHVDAWNKLDWVESRMNISIEGFYSSVLCEGIYAIAYGDKITFLQLPSITRGVPSRTWTLGNLGRPVYQIAFIPSNDLLVAISRTYDHTIHRLNITLHLRTLSNNISHPGAISPILFSTLTDAYYTGHSWVRVMGALLGVILHINYRIRLEIWDWTTCQKITMLESDETKDLHQTSAFDSFEFFLPTSFLLPRQGALEVYQIPVDTLGAPPIHTASFCLPPLALGSHHVHSWIWSAPLSHDNINEGDRRSNRSPLPSPTFHMAEDSQYIGIGWSAAETERDNGTELRVLFQVPVSVLRRSAMYENPLAISWDAWSKSVYFGRDHMSRRDYDISGGRLIHLPDSSLHCNLSLFDLNPLRAANGQCSTTPNSESFAHNHVHTIESKLLRDGQITIGLPCSVASRALSIDKGSLRASIHCDNEHIVIWRTLAPRMLGADADAREEDYELIILTL